jgi:hypothetical protein
MKTPIPLVGAAYDSLKIIVAHIGDRDAFLRDEILQDATLMRFVEAGEYLGCFEFSSYYDLQNAWSF